MCSHKNSEHSKTCQCYEYSREGDGTCVHHMTEKTGAGGNAGNAPKTNMAGAGPDKIDGGAGATSGVIVAILGTIVTIVVLAVMFYIWHVSTTRWPRTRAWGRGFARGLCTALAEPLRGLLSLLFPSVPCPQPHSPPRMLTRCPRATPVPACLASARLSTSPRREAPQ